MKRIGLTGVVGSGKSTAAEHFSSLGAPIFIADNYAKNIMNNNHQMKKQIRHLLGDKSYKDGMINRKFISNKIFNNKLLLASINKLIHPLVHKEFNFWISKQNFSYVIYEAALIFENKAEKNFDKIICIKSPMELIYERLKKRDNYNPILIKKILDNQISQNYKCQNSDYCINNIKLEDLKSKIDKIHSSLI